MRVCTENGVAMAMRQVDQRRAKLQDSRGNERHELALAHAVHRHVDIVAAAGGMEPACHIVATRFPDEPLDQKKQIFTGVVE
jgi:hypothetical protein